MTSLWVRVLSVAVTVSALGGAVAIGGGSLPPLARMAARSSEAAENLEIANRNIASAVRDTRALETIVSAVGEQLKASERLLDTQLRIEASTRSTADRSARLTNKIDAVGDLLRGLRDELAVVARLARRAGALTDSSADAADRLQSTLGRLRARFDQLIEQSRELNRKARGYEELRDGPG